MILTPEKKQELVARIVDAAAPVEIILFGSAVSGEVRSGGDIDLLVLAQEGSHRRKTAQSIYRRLVGFGLPLDVIVATPQDFRKYGNSPGLIYREALRNGIELYAA